MKNSVIRLEDVWKIYMLDETEVPAVRGIDVNIKNGGIINEPKACSILDPGCESCQ